MPEVEGARQVIIILDLAALETIKNKRGDFELLNCDDHKGIAKKTGRNPAGACVCECVSVACVSHARVRVGVWVRGRGEV